MTTRRIMITVLAAALIAGGWGQYERRRRCLSRVAMLVPQLYFAGEGRHDRYINRKFFLPDGTMKPEVAREFDAEYAALSARQARLRRAAWVPWAGLEPGDL